MRSTKSRKKVMIAIPPNLRCTAQPADQTRATGRMTTDRVIAVYSDKKKIFMLTHPSPKIASINLRRLFGRS